MNPVSAISPHRLLFSILRVRCGLSLDAHGMQRIPRQVTSWTFGCSSIHTGRGLMGIKKMLKDKLEEGKSDFQNWAEFENRGFRSPEYTSCWIIEQYGHPQEVLKKDIVNLRYDKFKSLDARNAYARQTVYKPYEVLVKIHASSINPIDVKMCQGYGQTLLNFRRNVALDSITKFARVIDYSEFPLVLGRDFSGTILDVGSAVTDVVPGDEVFGAQEIHRSGSLADHICVSLKCIARKPKTLSHIEAATLPYVALTSLSALQDFASNAQGKRALLLGGSGGVGTFAIQYLKAKGAYVAVTCSPVAQKLCTSLGADKCFDYTSDNHKELLLQEPRFDIVFDIVGEHSPHWSNDILRPGGLFSSLLSPLVENTDSMGVVAGLSASVGVYLKSVLFSGQNRVAWPAFTNDHLGLSEVSNMVDEGFIKPVVQSVFDFSDIPKAFDAVASGKSKGKIAINVSGLPEASAKPDIEKVIHL